MLAGLGVQVPLEVTLEQVTYFRPERPDDFAPGRLPLWIWMDDPSYYGFPCYGEADGQGGAGLRRPDRSTPTTGPSDRDPAMEDRLAEHLRAHAARAAARRCGRCAASTR